MYLFVSGISTYLYSNPISRRQELMYSIQESGVGRSGGSDNKARWNENRLLKVEQQVLRS